MGSSNFVSYEIAVALKELGFDEPCFTTYDNEGRLRNPFDFPRSEYSDNLPYIEDTKEWIYNSDLNNPANFHAAHNPTLLKFFLDNPFTAAPLWQQAFDWFRSKCNALSIIFNDDGDVEHNNICFNYEIRFITISFKEELKASVVGNYRYDTYEEARLACLVKLIEICKEKKS